MSQCEGMCCYDGAYLDAQEEAFLTELVAKVPALRDVLPPTFIVDGFWDGEPLGRKTATRAQNYRNPDYPAHFTRTRCVFSDAQGYCELEKFARSGGQHPWSYKPMVCWLFPLHIERGRPRPPPADAARDPYRQPGYPGYATVVPCGRHDPGGRPWRQALQAELAYLQSAVQQPLLGSPGHSVEELLAARGAAAQKD